MSASKWTLDSSKMWVTKFRMQLLLFSPPTAAAGKSFGSAKPFPHSSLGLEGKNNERLLRHTLTSCMARTSRSLWRNWPCTRTQCSFPPCLRTAVHVQKKKVQSTASPLLARIYVSFCYFHFQLTIKYVKKCKREWFVPFFFFFNAKFSFQFWAKTKKMKNKSIKWAG